MVRIVKSAVKEPPTPDLMRCHKSSYCDDDSSNDIGVERPSGQNKNTRFAIVANSDGGIHYQC